MPPLLFQQIDAAAWRSPFGYHITARMLAPKMPTYYEVFYSGSVIGAAHSLEDAQDCARRHAYRYLKLGRLKLQERA